MNFEDKNKSRKFEKKLGFVIMYLIFTIILYFIMRTSNKIPENWTIFHISLLTLFLILLGTFIRLLLK